MIFDTLFHLSFHVLGESGALTRFSLLIGFIEKIEVLILVDLVSLKTCSCEHVTLKVYTRHCPIIFTIFMTCLIFMLCSVNFQLCDPGNNQSNVRSGERSKNRTDELRIPSLQICKPRCLLAHEYLNSNFI